MSVYTALSGVIQQGQKLDTISNNIANANTKAFKSDKQIFREQLVRPSLLSKQVVEIAPLSTSLDKVSDVRGKDVRQVGVTETYTNFDQGHLKPTHHVLDFAIEGRGFFEILTPAGLRLTRSGNFNVDNSGRLVTQRGFPVLRERQEENLDPHQRVIQVINPNTIQVSKTGEIYSEKQFLGKLSVVDVEDLRVLKKEGNSLYSLPIEGESLLQPSAVSVFQGFVEGSNVNLISEMTDMIQTTRAFESNKEMIKAFDKINEKLVNNVV